jgi:hypothetical protein
MARDGGVYADHHPDFSMRLAERLLLGSICNGWPRILGTDEGLPERTYLS